MITYLKLKLYESLEVLSLGMVNRIKHTIGLFNQKFIQSNGYSVSDMKGVDSSTLPSRDL